MSLRTFLGDNFAVVIVALLLVALAGGYVAYSTHAGEQTRTEEQTLGTWNVETEFQHAATVQRETAVFDEGERLENRSLYFTKLMPTLEGTYTLTHDGTSGETATAHVKLTRIIRAVDGSNEAAVYWEERQELASAEVDTLDEGETFDVEFTMNVPEVSERSNDIETDLGATPGTTEVLVRAETVVEGVASGEQFTEIRQGQLEVQPGSDTYTVETRSREAATHEASELVTVPVDQSPAAVYGSLLLAVVSLGSVTGLVMLRKRNLLAVSPVERTRYEFETAREDFDKWITPGDVPDVDSDRVVRLDSLEGIVDVAIDSNRRVIETEDGRYFVLIDKTRYVFAPEHSRSDYS